MIEHHEVITDSLGCHCLVSLAQSNRLQETNGIHDICCCQCCCCQQRQMSYFCFKKIIILFTMKMFCFLLFWFSFVLLQSYMCSILRKEAMNIALSAHITVINDIHACEFVSAIGSNIYLTNTQLQNPMRSFQSFNKMKNFFNNLD